MEFDGGERALQCPFETLLLPIAGLNIKNVNDAE